MFGPKRDPTANLAIAHIMREEARARKLSVQQYLAFLEGAPLHADARVAAEQLRERLAAI